MAHKPFQCFFIDCDSVNVFRSSVKKERLNINLRWCGSVEVFESIIREATEINHDAPPDCEGSWRGLRVLYERR